MFSLIVMSIMMLAFSISESANHGIMTAIASTLPSSGSVVDLPDFHDYTVQDEEYFPVAGKDWVRGGGATALGDFIANLIPSYSLANSNAVVTFSSLGTSRGYCRLMDFLTQCKNPWAGTGTDLQRPTSLDFTLATRGPTESNFVNYADTQLYPFGAAPIALVHSIQNLTAPLVLSREIAAKMFRKCDLAAIPSFCQPDDIRRWDDARILLLNPGQESALQAAGEIKLVVRQDSAGITAGVKRGLAIFEPSGFGVQINNAQIDPDSSVWRSVNATFVYGLRSIAAAVREDVSSISYVPLNMALEQHLDVIGLTSANAPMNRTSAVFPDYSTSVRAMLERGLDFGSDGDVPPSRRTVEFNGGTNDRAWPLVMGAYIAIRLNTSRPNATCRSRKELLRFLEYLLQPDNPRVESVADISGLVRMPSEALADNLAHLHANLRCDGVLVAGMFIDRNAMWSIRVYAPEGLTSTVVTLTSEFTRTLSSTSTTFNLKVTVHPLVGSVPSTWTRPSIDSMHARAAQVVLAPRAASLNAQSATTASIPFVSLALIARFNWCGSSPVSMQNCTNSPRLNLGAQDVRDILRGDIAYWNDSRLQVRNPTVDLPAGAPIRLILPPDGPWRQGVAEAVHGGLSIDDLRPSPTKPFAKQYENLQVSLAFLQKTQFALFFYPSISDESILSEEQTSVASLDGVFPSRDRLRDGTYPFVLHIDLHIPRVFDECDSLRSYHNAGGFLGISATRQESLTAHVSDLARWLVSFSTSYATESEAEETARRSIIASAAREDQIALVLSSIHGVSLYSQASRPAFFSSLVCADGSKVIVQAEQLNVVSPGVIYVVGVGFASVSILLFLILAIWVHLNRHRKVVKFASPSFLLQILLGATLCVSTLYPLSLQEYNFDRAAGHDSDELWNLDIACATIPWLYTIGYTTVFLALFLKTWRLVKIFDNPRMRKFHRMRDKDLSFFLFTGLFFVIFLNIVWFFTDRLHWERVPIQLSSDRLTVLSSVGLCTVNENPWVAVAPLLTTTLCIMVGGLVLCYYARNLPSDFQESSWISLCLIMQCQSLLFALPVLTFTADSSVVTFITKAVVILLNSTGSVLIIFIPKLWVMYGLGAVASSSGGNDRQAEHSMRLARGVHDGSSFAMHPSNGGSSSFHRKSKEVPSIEGSTNQTPKQVLSLLSPFKKNPAAQTGSEAVVVGKGAILRQGTRKDIRPTSSELKHLTAQSVGDIAFVVTEGNWDEGLSYKHSHECRNLLLPQNNGWSNFSWLC